MSLQKAGFMLVELAFASSVRDRRHVVILVSGPLSPLCCLHCCTRSVVQDLVDVRTCVLSLQKHQDAFASAFGFFLIGFDFLSGYSSPQNIHKGFFQVTDPMLWFFKVLAACT